MESVKNTRLLSIFSIALLSVILISSQSQVAFAGMGGYEDKDGDGFSTFQGDCNDNNPEVYPGEGCDPEEFIFYIVDETQDLEENGYLSENQVEGLLKSLDQAVDRLESDNYNSAAGKLNSFINKLNSYVNNGTLPAEEAEHIIQHVQMLIDIIS